ncbi:MAG TPA: STAS domain-containing protein [Spirochaetota bacterium]|jgi:anti-anti-sigma factor|nr:STAS domain-containing protein [Spirochaetota bacterium]HOT19770.1 STAS domain-containing protein [Spirochaetota bacterium]HPD05350.1 STAS domain-containing protein [Spirochaetota bacterium]HQG41809.1 STAS domain-containing protein [Spirochaetota bacterium]HQK07573.1 STAS domain-containing protein [Spirochaetota bacterium]
MIFTKREEDNRCIFIINEQLNPRTLKELIEEMHNFLQNDSRDAIIDMSNVEIVDSTILAGFMTLYNNFKNNHKKFRLINTNSYVKRIIELASLDTFLLEE